MINRKKYMMHFAHDHNSKKEGRDSYFYADYFFIFLFGLVFIRPFRSHDRVLIDITNRGDD